MDDADSSSLSGSSTADQDTLCNGPQAKQVVPKRRVLRRRGHLKSRSGCATCKRRKVKCDEVVPECGACRRLGIHCELTQVNRSLTKLTPTESPMPGVLDISDLKFFQHFLLDAYPSLPIQGRQVWQDVGQMSHEFEFLARAMLSLGATHLGNVTTANYVKPALNHRVASMSALNKHLSKPHLPRADADAALGALLALAFQSAYMPDGMVDFLTLVRGCVLIASQKSFDLEGSLFRQGARDAFVEVVTKMFAADDPSSLLYEEFADKFCHSVSRLGSICSSTAEHNYLAFMTRVATLATVNAVEGFCENSFLYNKVGELSHTEFTAFVNPKNYTSQLVIMHMLCLDFVMSRKAVDQPSESPTHVVQSRTGFDCRKSMILVWIGKIVDNLPKEYRPYADGLYAFVKCLASAFLTKQGTWRPFLLTPPRSESEQ